MFTRYKGIDVPQNYSGSRFKSEPPNTEMKTHKPTPIYSPTKTSISPSFERARNHGYQNVVEGQIANESIDNVSDFNDFQEENYSLENEYFEPESKPLGNGDSNQEDEDKCEQKQQKEGVFDELKPLINKFLKNINSEDLLLLSLIILLFGEGNEESSDLIIPLLCLFLYH